MKILFFSRYFYPHIGGVEKHVLEVSRELLKKGHEISVICETTEKEIEKEEEFKKIKVYRIFVGENEFFKKFTVWKWLLTHRSLISDADVIHAHDVFYWWMPFLLLQSKKKIYTTFHGYTGNTFPNWKEKILHRLAIKSSKKTMSIGSFYEKWYGEKSDLVLYGGVEKKLLRDSIASFQEDKQVQHDRKLKLVFVGRLEEETGIMMYLKAAKIIKEKHIPFKLEIAGDGSLRKICEKYIQENKLNVFIHGFIENIESFLQHADIAFVSRYLSILEALALRKPIVAHYNNEVKKDYLKMTPFTKWITICNSEKDIANAVVKILEKPDKQQVEQSFKWVSKQSWENVAKNYVSLWKEHTLLK